MSSIEFMVHGIPATAGSKSGFVNKKTGKVIMAPANKRQKPWMAAVTAAAVEAYSGPVINHPIELHILFYLPRPKNHYGTGRNEGILKDNAPTLHTKKPDSTKLLRAVEDALTGIIWRDDSQVCLIRVGKIYANAQPGAKVTVHVCS